MKLKICFVIVYFFISNIVLADKIKEIDWLNDNLKEKNSLIVRLKSLQLLKIGKKYDYNQFVKHQIHNKNKLTFKSFKELSKIIKKLDAHKYRTLEFATIIASLAETKQIREIAKKYIKQDLSTDKMIFISSTMPYAGELYPFISDIKKQDNDLFWLKSAFPYKMHFRHMLFSEGGISIYKSLRDKIKYNTINQDTLDFWYCFWLINTTGFCENNKVGGFLDENVFQSMNYLKKLLDKMLQDPNFDPLIPYLQFRAKLLGFKIQENDLNTEDVVLTQLGAMLQLFNIEEGNKLKQGFYKINKDEQKNIKKQFLKLDERYDDLVVTYAPAYFINGLNKNKGNLSITITELLPKYVQIVHKHRKLMQDNKISKEFILSFKGL